jgi:hypothetical protein
MIPYVSYMSDDGLQRKNKPINLHFIERSYVKSVPCHHSMLCPQVANGEDSIQIWRVDANILNKQSQTANKGWSYSLGVGRAAKNVSLFKKFITKCTQGLRLRFFGMM